MTATGRWEYLFVHLGHARGFKDTSWRPFKVNNEKLPRWEAGPDWKDYFQQLGAEGWEFVTFDEQFIADPVIGGKLAIFKRFTPHAEVKRVGTNEQQQQPKHTSPFTTTS